MVPDVAGANASWAKAKKAHAREVSREQQAEDLKKVRTGLLFVSLLRVYLLLIHLLRCLASRSWTT